MWRFLFSPGLVSVGAVAGVLMPSADRVGRLFPLTVASVLAPGSIDLAKTLVEADAWFASVEATARAALDPELDLDAFDERINAIMFPAANIFPVKSGGEPGRTMPAESKDMRAIHSRLGREQDRAVEASITQLRAEFGREIEPRALWLTKGSRAFGEWVLASAGLPQGEQFCALLDGDWPGHGWT